MKRLVSACLILTFVSMGARSVYAQQPTYDTAAIKAALARSETASVSPVSASMVKQAVRAEVANPSAAKQAQPATKKPFWKKPLFFAIVGAALLLIILTAGDDEELPPG